MSETLVKAALRGWIEAHCEERPAGVLDDQTKLIGDRWLTSIQVAELLLYIEELRGEEIDVELLTPGTFCCVDTVWARFFSGVAA